MPDRSNFDHYVAQHYIKLFTDSGGEAHVVDVVQKTVARYTDFSQIMGRRNWSIAQSIEDGFTRLENDIAGALRRLNQDPTAIRGLAASTCVGLRNYICMHAARAVGVHEALNQTNVQFQHEMRRVAHRLAPPSFDPNSISFPEVNREASLHHGIIVGDLMSVALQMRGCIAVIAPDDYVFVLGDNPFAKLTSQEHFYMRGALPSPTTYFWFPLNPKLGLFFCEGIGNEIIAGHIKTAIASKKMVYALNRAEVFVASEYFASNSREVASNMKRLPNVGDRRNTVTALDWAPLIINQNTAVAPIKEEAIDQIRAQL